MSTIQYRPDGRGGAAPAAAVVTLKNTLGPLDRTGAGAWWRAWARDPHGWLKLWLHGLVVAAALAIFALAVSTGRSSGRPAAEPAPALRGPIAGATAAAAPSETDAGPDADAPEFRLQDLPPEAAAIYNDAVPISTAPNPPAKPFMLKAATLQDERRAVDCLTAAVYYEAATEPLSGKQAVAQVVLNRVRDPAYPKSVCGVVFDGSTLPTGWQFSFTGDGSLAHAPNPKLWRAAQQVAEAALHGFVARQAGQATHYHTRWVAPYWSPRLDKVANIGSHIFYRWLGARGMPAAFTGEYAGVEPYLPQIAALDAGVTEAAVDVAAPADVVTADDHRAAVEIAEAPVVPAAIEMAAQTVVSPAAAPQLQLKPVPPEIAVAAPPPPTQAVTAAPPPRQNGRVAFASSW